MENLENKDSLFFSILKKAMQVPGVKINREEFLRKELRKKYKEDKVDLAIAYNPAYAGITVKEIGPIAKSCIKLECNQATATSAAAGIPGGLAMAGTVPADIIQYFVHLIRILQKLIYLYGWEDISEDDGELDDETINLMTLFIGVMFGVNAANATIAKLAQCAAVKAEKTLIRKALTKGTIYPIVKKVATILGVRMTKEVFAKGVGKFIPILGGIISGGITYATFKPCANRLKEYMEGMPTADVKFYREGKETVVDVDFTDVDLDGEEG